MPRKPAAPAAAIDASRAASGRIRLRPGDPVVIQRDRPPSGTWRRYAGREGWVARINRERFPDGRTYVEVGVTWVAPHVDHGRVREADAWFLPDELVRRFL